MTEPEFIDPKQLQSGPIRHESLSPQMLELIEGIYELIGPYLSETLGEFEAGFLRDTRPEVEIAIWCRIAASWLAYHEEYLDDEFQDDEAEKEMVGALVLISTGVRDAEALGVPVEVGLKLLECYDVLLNDDLE
jgi:hypothetical protein